MLFLIGRNEYDKIAKDIGRPIEECTRYCKTFWERGASIFSPAEWDRLTKQIEKVI